MNKMTKAPAMTILKLKTAVALQLLQTNQTAPKASINQPR